MSDHIERECRKCGSLLHHEDKCPGKPERELELPEASSESVETSRQNELLPWLRHKITEAESALRFREQAEEVFRSGTDESWEQAANMHPSTRGKSMSKADRLRASQSHGRIAEKCRHEVAMFKSVLSHLPGGKEAAKHVLQNALTLPRVIAMPIVNAILKDLRGRKGVGDALNVIEGDIYDEMRGDLIAVIEKLLSEHGDSSTAMGVSASPDSSLPATTGAEKVNPIHPLRLSDKLEGTFREEWRKFLKCRPGFDILCGPEVPFLDIPAGVESDENRLTGGYQPYPHGKMTQRDHMVAVELIQWLGSPIGFAFLTGALSHAGWSVTSSPATTVPASPETLMGERRVLDWIRLQADQWSTTGDNQSLRDAMALFVRTIDTLGEWDKANASWPHSSVAEQVPASPTDEEIARACLESINAMSDCWSGGRSSTRREAQEKTLGFILAAITKAKSPPSNNSGNEAPVASNAVDAPRQNPLSALVVTGERLRTQDNRCTSNPMFCVQIKRRDVGYDSAYSDRRCWHDSANEQTIFDDDPDFKEPEGDEWDEFGYRDRWETVMVAFTEGGCEEYLRLNGHNDRRRAHNSEVRIYVQSFNRCPEMIGIRSALMEACSVSDRGGSLATGAAASPDSSPPPSKDEEKRDS